MHIGIYDVDSKIPNLALMKISAWHKSQGDETHLYMPLMHDHYDKVYASKIFNFSSQQYIRPDMIVGGTGVDLMTNLPQEMESMEPDYELYGYPHNIGFTMRGCRLRCSFCVVPQKEGKPKSNNTIDEIWTQRNSNFIVLLDNDFFGNPQWSERIDEIKRYDLKVNFSQGLNIRNLKPDQAEAVASVKFRSINNTSRQVYFAWDDPRHEKLIIKGINLCIESGIRPHEMAFYVLIGYHSTEEEDLYRVETLRDLGCDPFSMPYHKDDPYQRLFTRWVNHKAIFNSVKWSDYKSNVKRKVTPDAVEDLFH